MTIGVINHVAQCERDLLIERTHAGVARAKADGSVLGRPATLGNEEQQAVLAALGAGDSVSELARHYGTSRQTIMRIRDAEVAA